MRLTKRKTENRKPGTGNRTPIAGQPLIEEPAKKRRNGSEYTQEEIEYIIQKRNMLIPRGLTDREIAEKIAPGIDRTVRSIATMIHRLVKRGKLTKNHNNRIVNAYTDEDIDLIKLRWQGLILKGFKQEQIARKLAKEMRRTLDSMRVKLRKMVNAGELQENPNAMKKFTEGESEIIMRKRYELIRGGLTDWSISKKLADEMDVGMWPVFCAIGRLILGKEIPENPNKQKHMRLTEEEKQFIMKRREELILEGLNDGQIAGRIAKEIEKEKKSISDAMYRFARAKKIPANPNKQPNFTKKEIRFIDHIRDGLIHEGLNDRSIAKRLSEKMDRTMSSILTIINRLVKREKLKKNPNMRDKFTQEEVQHIIQRRHELIQEGLKDAQISKILSDEMQKSWNSIYSKILRLFEQGMLPKNPNKRVCNPKHTEQQLQEGLAKAADAMEQFGDNP
jgi:predicted transcriptional regulator